MRSRRSRSPAPGPPRHISPSRARGPPSYNGYSRELRGYAPSPYSYRDNYVPYPDRYNRRQYDDRSAGHAGYQNGGGGGGTQRRYSYNRSPSPLLGGYRVRPRRSPDHRARSPDAVRRPVRDDYERGRFRGKTQFREEQKQPREKTKERVYYSPARVNEKVKEYADGVDEIIENTASANDEVKEYAAKADEEMKEDYDENSQKLSEQVVAPAAAVETADTVQALHIFLRAASPNTISHTVSNSGHSVESAAIVAPPGEINTATAAISETSPAASSTGPDAAMDAVLTRAMFSNQPPPINLPEMVNGAETAPNGPTMNERLEALESVVLLMDQNVRIQWESRLQNLENMIVSMDEKISRFGQYFSDQAEKVITNLRGMELMMGFWTVPKMANIIFLCMWRHLLECDDPVENRQEIMTACLMAPVQAILDRTEMYASVGLNNEEDMRKWADQFHPVLRSQSLGQEVFARDLWKIIGMCGNKSVSMVLQAAMHIFFGCRFSYWGEYPGSPLARIRIVRYSVSHSYGELEYDLELDDDGSASQQECSTCGGSPRPGSPDSSGPTSSNPDRRGRSTPPVDC